MKLMLDLGFGTLFVSKQLFSRWTGKNPQIRGDARKKIARYLEIAENLRVSITKKNVYIKKVFS